MRSALLCRYGQASGMVEPLAGVLGALAVLVCVCVCVET